MTDDAIREHATGLVLQRYYLTDLKQARLDLTPDQFQGLLAEIDAVQEHLSGARIPPYAHAPAVAGQPAQGTSTMDVPAAVPRAPGIDTPFGRILPATGLLLALNWIAFVVESLQPGGSQSTLTIYHLGGITNDTLLTGQYWRLVAACFLHIGIMHIATNSLALIWLGSLTERLYGTLRYVGIYLAAGIGGSLLTVLTEKSSDISAGASGAIFGLLAAALVGAWRNRRVIHPVARRQIYNSLGGVLVINLAISFIPGISLSGHLGGLVTGAILSLLIPFRSPAYTRAYATIANILSALFVVVALALMLTWVGSHP